MARRPLFPAPLQNQYRPHHGQWLELFGHGIEWTQEKNLEVLMNLNEVIQEITDKSGAKAVFGEPFMKDRVTFIPVAKVSIHACGCDRDAQAGGKSQAEGAGRKKKGPCLGVAVKTAPMGYIEIRQGRARFVEIVDRTKLMQAGFFLCGLGLFLLARLARGK
jgi:uncharacterized spore protein YtfJ